MNKSKRRKQRHNNASQRAKRRSDPEHLTQAIAIGSLGDEASQHRMQQAQRRGHGHDGDGEHAHVRSQRHHGEGQGQQAEHAAAQHFFVANEAQHPLRSHALGQRVKDPHQRQQIAGTVRFHAEAQMVGNAERGFEEDQQAAHQKLGAQQGSQLQP